MFRGSAHEWQHSLRRCPLIMCISRLMHRAEDMDEQYRQLALASHRKSHRRRLPRWHHQRATRPSIKDLPWREQAERARHQRVRSVIDRDGLSAHVIESAATVRKVRHYVLCASEDCRVLPFEIVHTTGKAIMIGNQNFDQLVGAAPVNFDSAKVDWDGIKALLDSKRVNPSDVIAVTWCSLGVSNIEALVDSPGLTIIYPHGVINSVGKRKTFGGALKFSGINFGECRQIHEEEHTDDRGLGKYCIEFTGPAASPGTASVVVAGEAVPRLTAGNNGGRHGT